MTTEHRIVFEPAAIRSIVFECNDCGGSLSVTGGKDVRHGDDMVLCPSCGKSWMTDYTGANIYRKFLGALRDIMEAQENEKKFTMRFELDATKPSGPHT